MATPKMQIFTNIVVQQVKAGEQGTFLDGITDESRLVNNDVIHLNEVGVDVNVLINNTTYPIPANSFADGDIPISLDKYETENTKITEDELYAIAYDKVGVVTDVHSKSIVRKKYARSLFNLAPQTHSLDTPIVKTTGDASNGLKILTEKDILSLKASFDALEIPEEGRVLVLSNEHINQLLLTEQKFASQYYDYQRGKLLPLMYGFKVYSHFNLPYFTSAFSKKSFGAVAANGDRKASIAFYEPNIFKATGSTKMYYQSAEIDPFNRQTVMGFTHRFLALPKKQRYIGALVSDNA